MGVWGRFICVVVWLIRWERVGLFWIRVSRVFCIFGLSKLIFVEDIGFWLVMLLVGVRRLEGWLKSFWEGVLGLGFMFRVDFVCFKMFGG